MAQSSSPTSWDPRAYLAFSEARGRPAADLIARIKQTAPARIFDLGCGAGNITRLLASRWPRARVTGVDSSAAMLARARANDDAIRDAIRWVQEDIAAWAPRETVDLIVSNAALHWLDAHDALFPRLIRCLNAGGELAVQMPRNFHAPSHRAIAETATNQRWKDRLLPLLREPPVHAPDFYIAKLSALTSVLDVWETTYWHELEGDNPVVEWTKGTALRPFLELLPDDDRQAFLSEYAERIAEAYPPRPDGGTLFPFRRLFIVAKR